MKAPSVAVMLAAALAAVPSGAALADAIDGDWCAADGRHMSIKGPAILTPAGHNTQGDYSRHAFSYVVPQPEPGAGRTISMRLVSEDTVHVAAGTAEAQVWHRCQAPVS